jgi:hypothetical protein
MLYLNQKLVVIGNDCFKECKKLTQIEIPSSVTKIGDRAFIICTSLKFVVIASSVIFIVLLTYAYN